MTKDSKEQIKEFDKLIKKYPFKEDLYIGRALLYMEIKQYKKAAEDFKRAYANYVSYDILDICERNNLIKETEELYTKIINADKNNFDNYTSRAGFYIRIGETKKALADYESALKLSPNNKVVLMLKETLIKELKK